MKFPDGSPYHRSEMAAALQDVFPGDLEKQAMMLEMTEMVMQQMEPDEEDDGSH